MGRPASRMPTSSRTRWSAPSSASWERRKRSCTSNRPERLTSRFPATCGARLDRYFMLSSSRKHMASRPSRSLKHEYELYLEREIENYKESVPRSVLLSIGDDAVRALAAQQQFALTELLLVDEVDKIIFKRLRLPAYATWRKRRVKQLEELRRSEHWGLRADDVVVRAAQAVGDSGRVLVAGSQVETPALYLAAKGCEV